MNRKKVIDNMTMYESHDLCATHAFQMAAALDVMWSRWERVEELVKAGDFDALREYVREQGGVQEYRGDDAA